MTTLIRDPNTNSFALPESISAAQAAGNWSIPAKNVGINFGRTTPSYSNLINTNLAPASINRVSVPTALVNSGTSGINPSTLSFTQALIQILKDAQGRNITGTAKLMKQGQDITGLGINDAVTNFANPLLTPDAGTSLGRSATGEFDPALLSIENQQKLASQNLGNITDLVNMTGDNYQKEEDRKARAEENRLDRIASAAKAASDVKFDTQGNSIKFTKDFESIKAAPYLHPDGGTYSDNDQYVDPQEWVAARTLWATKGGSDASFVSNFKRYLNPKDYKQVGFKEPIGDVSPEMQALLDSLGG